MDYRLIHCLLLVTLSWRFMGGYAQNSSANATPTQETITTIGATVTTGPSSAATGATVTTGPSNAATGATVTTGPSNAATGATVTTGPSNAATGATVTTGPSNAATGATVTTGQSSAATGATVTTGPSSAATGATVTSGPSSAATGATVNTGGANTMVVSTGANNSTMSTTTTTLAPTLIPNDTVVDLDTPFSRNGCGTQQLCLAEPSKCDPSSSACFFLAAKQQSGQTFQFDLSGQSDGYIAQTLSTGSTGGDTTYVCAKSRNAVKFFGAVLNNGKLTKSKVSANSVKGRVNGKHIQCTFLALLPTSTSRATGFTVSVSSGAYNDTTEDLGNPSPVIKAAVANLTDPNANVTNEVNTTTPVVDTNATTAAPVGTDTTLSVAVNTTATAVTSNTIPVAPLSDTVTTTDCGSKKLCVAEPKTCDPSAGNKCYFISAKQQSGQLYDFELSGQSDGYIAAGLSTSSGQADSHRAYICANHSNAVRFFTGTLTNFVVNLASLDASTVKGKVNQGKIQCTFSATLPNTTTRAAGYSLSVSSGSYNPATGEFGQASFRIQTDVVNLSDPNATISNQINSTSGAYPAAHQQSLMMPALLLVVTILAFTMQ
nr:mucin-5AC [Nothobranchius furzeri]